MVDLQLITYRCIALEPINDIIYYVNSRNIKGSFVMRCLKVRLPPLYFERCPEMIGLHMSRYTQNHLGQIKMSFSSANTKKLQITCRQHRGNILQDIQNKMNNRK